MTTTGMPAFFAASSCGCRTRGSGAVFSTMTSGFAVMAAFMPCTHSDALPWLGYIVNFIPTFSAMAFIVSWMFWLNGLGTSGMRNMLLPLRLTGRLPHPAG